jgi:hypothetical protein
MRCTRSFPLGYFKRSMKRNEMKRPTFLLSWTSYNSEFHFKKDQLQFYCFYCFIPSSKWKTQTHKSIQAQVLNSLILHIDFLPVIPSNGRDEFFFEERWQIIHTFLYLLQLLSFSFFYLISNDTAYLCTHCLWR